MADRFEHDEGERGARARERMESPEVFFKHYWPRLLRFLIIQASDSSMAEDAAGDTFEAAWGNWDNLLTYERPDSWLFKVGVRRLRRLEEHARARGSLTEDPDSNLADLRSAAVMDEWVESNLDLAAALRLLPRRQAEVIACTLLNCKERETAEILGISEGTVKTQLSRAKTKLRMLLHDPEIPDVARRDPS